jgi:hypothetical protein
MKYLLDTDTSVYWLRGRVSVQERMQAVDPEELVLSVITLAELRYGAATRAGPGRIDPHPQPPASCKDVLPGGDASRGDSLSPRRRWENSKSL